MPVQRSGRYRPQDFLVLVVRFSFYAIGVAAALLGIIFFIAGVGFLSDGASRGNATFFLLGLPYTAFGLVGMWMAWRLLLYLEEKDVKQSIQLICFGLFFLMLINLFGSWSSGAAMFWPLLYYGIGAFCLWWIARRLPEFCCRILFPQNYQPF